MHITVNVDGEEWPRDYPTDSRGARDFLDTVLDFGDVPVVVEEVYVDEGVEITGVDSIKTYVQGLRIEAEVNV